MVKTLRHLQKTIKYFEKKVKGKEKETAVFCYYMRSKHNYLCQVNIYYQVFYSDNPNL